VYGVEYGVIGVGEFEYDISFSQKSQFKIFSTTEISLQNTKKFEKSWSKARIFDPYEKWMPYSNSPTPITP
jgi:hypothetical protein